MTLEDGCPYALTVPKPDAEAILVWNGISWPISTEAEAFKLARRVGVPGFWRLKSRHQTRQGAEA